jgi:hypothetical protein
MGKMVGAGAEIFDKLEPEPHKNGPAPQHWFGDLDSIRILGQVKVENLTLFCLCVVLCLILTDLRYKMPYLVLLSHRKVTYSESLVFLFRLEPLWIWMMMMTICFNLLV